MNYYYLKSSWCELIILQVFDDKCPITKNRIFKNSWMTNRLKILISKRDLAHDKLISHPNSKNEVLFKQLRNLEKMKLEMLANNTIIKN